MGGSAQSSPYQEVWVTLPVVTGCSKVQEVRAKAERRGMTSGVTASLRSDSTRNRNTSGRRASAAASAAAARARAEGGRRGVRRNEASSASGRTMEKASGTLRTSASQRNGLRTLKEIVSNTAIAPIETNRVRTAVRRGISH